MEEQPASSSTKKSSRSRNRGGRGGRGGRGRGRGGRGGSDDNRQNENAANVAGRGPKHFGSTRSRPDRITPKLSVDSSSEDEDADNVENGVGQISLSEHEDIDHITPVNAASSFPYSQANTSSQTAPSRYSRQEDEVDHITPVGNNTNVRQQHQQQQQQRERHAYCLICYSSKLHLRRAISPCGHDDICWACHLQMRYLHSDNKCPVCKSSNDTLIVDIDNLDVDEADADDGEIIHHKRFDQYHIWGNDLGAGFVYREDVGMYFPSEMYELDVVPLLGYGCGLPNCEFTNVSDTYVNERDMMKNIAEGTAASTTIGGGENRKRPQNQREVKKRLTGLKALKTHLRIDHGYTLCDLCVENKRNFVSKLARFTPAGLKHHQSKGDGEYSGFAGHPLCEFCRPQRFYDIVKLHEHLNKEHYKCHICEKVGRPNQFFKDYPRLERHFDREHYLCHDAQCLAARFVVFENEIDLRGHEQNVHGTSRRDGGTKIKLEFRVRREGEVLEQQNVPTGEDFQYGLNGEAFVPEALPGEYLRQANEPEISHPLHAARTAELRAQAAMVREREGGGAVAAGSSEAFPALGADDGASTSTGMLVGWSSDGARKAAATSGRGLRKTPVGRVTEEEFPSLGPGSGASAARSNMRAQIGLGRKATSRAGVHLGPNFSAVASRPTSSSSTASHGASTNMTSDNFPSLSVGRSRPSNLVPGMNGYQASAPNLNSQDNFPSLGGGAGGLSSVSTSARRPKSGASQLSNPYAAAQAHARKLNASKAPGLAAADFPPPPTASFTSSAKRSNVAAKAFAPKKPPPIDNMLQFPPPSSSSSQPATKAPPSTKSLHEGKSTIDSLKQTLGTVRYKKLKGLTKDFASGGSSPERYGEDIISLFDKGIRDEAFWEHIPSLISDLPDKSAADKALNHLESVRTANAMQEMEFGR